MHSQVCKGQAFYSLGDIFSNFVLEGKNGEGISFPGVVCYSSPSQPFKQFCQSHKLLSCPSPPFFLVTVRFLKEGLQKNDSGGERHKMISFAFPKQKKENKYVVQLFI